MSRRVLVGVGIVALVVLAAAGGFFYGTSVGEARATERQRQFLQQRFGAQGGQFPGTGQTTQPRQRGAGRFGGGILGTVEGIEGSDLIVSTADGMIRVQITDTTLIEKFKAVEVGELEIGERIVVSGSRNEDGSVTARSIQTLRAFPTPVSQP